MDKILKRIKKNWKVFSLQNKKDYYQLEEFLYSKGKVTWIFKDAKWVANRIYKYYDRVNFEGFTPWQLMKIKMKDFDLVIKEWQLSREEALLENTPVEAEISCDQVDWLSSLEEELT